jgi:hypothetical protein
VGVTKFHNKCLSSFRTTQVSSLGFLDSGLCSSNNSVRGAEVTMNDIKKKQEKLKSEINWIESIDFEKHDLSYRSPPLIAIRLLLITDIGY